MQKILTKLLHSHIESFEKKAQALVLEGSSWENNVISHSNELKDHLNSLVQNCKDKLLNQLSQNAQREHENRIKEILHTKMSDLPEKLASELRESYLEQIELFNNNMASILLQGFQLSNDETLEFLQDCESKSLDTTTSEFKQAFRNQANINLLRSFSNEFKKDNGKNRNWRDMEENQINELLKVCKNRVEALLN